MSADLDAAAERYGRQLVAAETRGHQDNERRELETEVRLRRERERLLRAENGRLQRENIALRRQVSRRAAG
jgi:hypothetical protein